MKRTALSAILLGCCILTGYARQPDYRQLADSCFYYLSQDDTLHFDRAFPRLTEAFDQASDPETYALKQELLAMRDRDQGIRLLLLEARKKYGSDAPATKRVHARMKRIDAENARRIRQIIDRYGWPGKDDIGEEANETLFLCIQHVDELEVQEKYLPLLKHAVDKGNAEGWHYAFLTDRIRMNSGRKQVYGTQTIVDSNGELDYVVPLEDPDNVDSLRRSVGLEPMDVYLDGAWDLEAYKRNLSETERKYKAYTASRQAETK